MSTIQLLFDEQQKTKERLGRRLQIRDDGEMEWLWDEVFSITENLAGRDAPPLAALTIAVGMMAWISANTGMPPKFIKEFIEQNWKDMHYLAQKEHEAYQERRISLDYLEKEQ